MLRFMDFSSWQGVLSTVLGLALFLLVGIGIRLLMMVTIQQRQQRMNRQINERLRTLIAAYKVLGGSFTGNLTVDPMHLRQLREAETPDLVDADPLVPAEGGPTVAEVLQDPNVPPEPRSGGGGEDSIGERKRRIRDAVEATLSDIFLLGTEEQVRLAEKAARELVAGHPVQTHELVVSLRDFIRKALDLEPIPDDLAIPMQGPTRPSSSGGRGAGGGDRSGRGAGGGGGGGGAGGGGGMGAGMGMGMGAGGGGGSASETSSITPRP